MEGGPFREAQQVREEELAWLPADGRVPRVPEVLHVIFRRPDQRRAELRQPLPEHQGRDDSEESKQGYKLSDGRTRSCRMRCWRTGESAAKRPGTRRRHCGTHHPREDPISSYSVSIEQLVRPAGSDPANTPLSNGGGAEARLQWLKAATTPPRDWTNRGDKRTAKEWHGSQDAAGFNGTGGRKATRCGGRKPSIGCGVGARATRRTLADPVGGAEGVASARAVARDGA